uniref:Uncharacterized protein n=1 Tax=Anguilla anguilla TaxID=7936 RepID=A0A0E9RN86_ANGAN
MDKKYFIHFWGDFGYVSRPLAILDHCTAGKLVILT